MGWLGVLGLRLFFSLILSLVISWLFFGNIPFSRVGGLAFALLGFAYILEHIKKGDMGGGNGN